MENSTPSYETTGWSPTCYDDEAPVPATVLDPFGGSGTVGLWSRTACMRNGILIEISPEYADMARKRVHNDAPLLSSAK